MSKKSCKMEACGCPTPRMCCSNMAVPTTAYQMVSVPQLVYDNVPAMPCGGAMPYGGGMPTAVSPAMSPYSEGCGSGGSWLIIIILLLCCCGGGSGCGDGCGDGCGGFGGSWIIIIILLLLCCGGSGFGY